jgi:serine/threonine protein kinase
MRYVHSRGIIHRDLKPSNILIERQGRALIGDFGSIRFTSDDATLTAESGTAHYAAPEQFQPDGELTPKVDVWSFGLILYRLFSNSAVFPASLSPLEVTRQIRDGYRPALPNAGGEYMRKLIARCWLQDLASRPTFGEILGEFQSRGFAILPLVDCAQVRYAVDGVLGWEVRAARLQSSSG